MNQFSEKFISKENLFYFSKLVLLFTIYYVTAKLGLKFDAVGGFATLVWPPTGLAIAGILILGYRYWPAIFLGAFLVNFSTGAPMLVALGIGLGNMLEAVVGVFLAKKLGFTKEKVGLKNILLFILCCVLINTALSASIGVTSLWLGGIVSSATYKSAWAAWWVGDALGALILANLLISFTKKIYFRNFKSIRIVEGLVFFSILIIANIAIFTNLFSSTIIEANNPILVYTIFPLLIWASLRFSTSGTALAVFITSAISITGTSMGEGPFRIGELSHNLFLLQGYIGVIAGTSMILAAAIEERADIDKAKSEFVSLASHQLRTPLTTMKWYSHSLIGDNAENLSPKQLEYIKEMYHNNERMIELVNSLLNVSRIELGRFLIKPIPLNVREVADEVIHDIEPYANRKNITIEKKYEENIPLIGADPNLVKIILQNLLTNSIKYSNERDIVHFYIQNNEKEILFIISDTGSGIPKNQQDKIFTKMFRTDNARMIDPEGSGLGLYIVKSIVEQSGGHMWFTSEVNKGSTFYVALPIVGMVKRTPGSRLISS